MLYHSYGSVPGMEALADYVHTLEKGEKKPGWGKVVRLVFCAAFILDVGGSLNKALGGKPLPWFQISGDEVTPATPHQIFYNDLEPSVSEPYISALKPHSHPTFFSELTVAPWKVIPSTYVVCENDEAIPLHTQEGMIAMAQGVVERSFDTVERCAASHSPFISMPEWLCSVLIKAAGGEVNGVENENGNLHI
ncbi:hypothetical protein G7Y89_g6824 [Cudoniella acicularis]|uniref:AB hydrolase-1 domain-containing protein n=1 Tax=Cudoniella acicularis TaxID=354080 RepID=A0A8H4RLJ4_9HELO|nr:hypothetical protein G7Y89_g6824 [Cudoniella acicularis]